MKVECTGGSITGEIEIAAPPEAVFDALATADDLMAWWGSDTTYRTHDWNIDLRPGGERSCKATDVRSGMTGTVRGVHLEVDRPRALAFTWMPSWETISATTVRFTLYSIPGGTRLENAARRVRRLPQIAGRSQPGLEARSRMAFRLSTKKGSIGMKTIRRFGIACLWLGAGVASAAQYFLLTYTRFFARYLRPNDQASAAQYFLLTYTAGPGVNFAALTPEQLGLLQKHAQEVQKRVRSGAILAGGLTNTPEDLRGIALIAAEDDAAARKLAEEDEAVRAGVLKVAVQSFSFAVPPPPPTTLVNDGKASYDSIARYVLAAARKMPEAKYEFRPSPDVRTFAQILAHIAEAQYLACGTVRGEPYKSPDFEQARTSKADLLSALETAFAYCDETWAKMADPIASERVTLFGQPRTKLGALDAGTAHIFEHYGNLATYLRIQGLVPPSSE